MKKLIVLVVYLHSVQAILSRSEISKRWHTYKDSYNRKFRSIAEENLRKLMFQTRLLEIEEHNERYRRGLETYILGINEFTDYTEEQLKPLTQGTTVIPKKTQKFYHLPPIPKTNAPDSFDWREKGMLTPVKYQGDCGSCWAFSTTGALESHYKIYYGRNISLSEQQLIDCITEGSEGCNGGTMTAAYTYITKNEGINYGSDYPYEAIRGDCRYNSSKPKVSIKSWGYLSERDEELLKSLVFQQGPVSVMVDARYFSGYSDGVFYNSECSSKSTNHAMVVVGYGSENGHDYWLLKNSWGSGWGLDGYIKLARNRDNHCGILNYISYPLFNI